MEAVESRVFFERFLVCAAICMVLKKTLDTSRQVDVVVVGSKGILVMLLQWLWVLTNHLSVCCITHRFLRKSQALFDIWQQ